MDRHTSGITGKITFTAAGTFIEFYFFIKCNTHIGPFCRVRSIGFFAMRTDTAHQPLSYDTSQSGSYKERLYTHIDQSRDRACSIVGMQGTENQMACQCGVNADSGRFNVTNLTDHNYIRVLAQNAAQSVGKGQPCFIIDGYLIDAFNSIFDRIFNRNDVFIRIVDISERRIQRCRFTAAGGTCNKYDAIGRVEQTDIQLLIIRCESQIIDINRSRRFIKNTHNDLFT